MGLVDALTAEDRVTLTITNCVTIIREAERSRAQADFMAKAVLNGVPYDYICATFNLKKEEHDG